MNFLNGLLKSKSFWQWVIGAAVQGSIVFLVGLSCSQRASLVKLSNQQDPKQWFDLTKGGQLSDYQLTGAVVTTATALIINMRILQDSSNLNSLLISALVASIGGCFFALSYYLNINHMLGIVTMYP